MENSKVIFNKESVSVILDNKKYEFLILGNGILPIGNNKDIKFVISIRNYLKKHYKEELNRIKIEQCLNESKINCK